MDEIAALDGDDAELAMTMALCSGSLELVEAALVHPARPMPLALAGAWSGDDGSASSGDDWPVRVASAGYGPAFLRPSLRDSNLVGAPMDESLTTRCAHR